MPYSVTLHHPQPMTPQLRQDAEGRYRSCLEQALGGAEQVLTAWRVWQDVENARGAGLSEADYRIARQWILTADLARKAGLGGLLDLDEAYFEVQPEC